MRSDVSSLRLCSALRQNFGLKKRVDCLSAERRSWPGWENEDRIRVTALWRRFISFAWQLGDRDSKTELMSEGQVSKPEAGKGEKPRCGLCGKTGRLTRTPCCGNWICDDADQ
jgi:hypothetical protein